MKPFTPRHKDLVTMFETSVKQFAARPHFGVKQDGRWVWTTYGEIGSLVEQFRGGVASLGVGKGDRVAVISDNRIEWAVGCYATYSLGAIYVPMYENQLDKEWKYILKNCGAKVALVAGKIAGRVKNLMADLPELKHVVDFDAPESDPASYRALLAVGKKAPAPSVKPDPSDVCTFIYTSGTTGNPKGVELTHANLASNISVIPEVVPFTPDERSVAFLPWAHVFGGSGELHGMTSLGCSMALAESTEKLVENLAEVKPTILFAVPRVWNKLYATVQKNVASQPKPLQALFHRGMKAAGMQKRGESLGLVDSVALALARKIIFTKITARFGGKLKFAISAAAALSREVAEFIDNLGVDVFEAYGMTETSAAATANTPAARRLGSVGKPVPGVEVKLDHEAPGADADSGELVVYGHCVMHGYHGLPDETAKVMTKDGGLRTGDLGRFDKDGFLFITGRVKELYKLENGKYVAPAPLEEQITLSPFIAQAMIHGADKPYNVALIVPELGSLEKWAQEQGLSVEKAKLLSHEQVRKLIAGELEKHSEGFKSYEKVKKFVLVDEAFSLANDMLTPTLKVKRRNVLKRYEGELNRLYS